LWGDEGEPEQEGRGTLVFVYFWTIVMIVVMAIYGNKLMKQGQLEAFRFTLLGFANYAFICCVLIGGLGVVEIEGREIEETGWYGQTSVLVLLTCLLGMVSSLAFSLWLRKRIKMQNAPSDDKQTGFVSFEEPPKTGTASFEEPPRNNGVVV
jgi:hypothetical protein